MNESVSQAASQRMSRVCSPIVVATFSVVDPVPSVLLWAIRTPFLVSAYTASCTEVITTVLPLRSLPASHVACLLSVASKLSDRPYVLVGDNNQARNGATLTSNSFRLAFGDTPWASTSAGPSASGSKNPSGRIRLRCSSN